MMRTLKVKACIFDIKDHHSAGAQVPENPIVKIPASHLSDRRGRQCTELYSENPIPFLLPLWRSYTTSTLLTPRQTSLYPSHQPAHNLTLRVR
jgi:hypothetical protein